MKPQSFYHLMIIRNTLKAKLFFLLALIYSLSILILSLVNLKNIEIVNLNASDKFYHATCYGIMTFLWLLYFYFKLRSQSVKSKLTLTLLIVFFGIIIEVLQLVLTDYRSFDWWDVVANITGVCIGLILFSIVKIFLMSKKFDF